MADRRTDEQAEDELRDRFADSALKGLLAANLFRDDNALALRSYFLAEQMLRVRKENADARKAAGLRCSKGVAGMTIAEAQGSDAQKRSRA